MILIMAFTRISVPSEPTFASFSTHPLSLSFSTIRNWYGFLNDIVGPENIAVIHTAFNLLATAILLPFNKYLEKLACLTIKDKEEDSDVPFLDERFLNTPSVATERAKWLPQ